MTTSVVPAISARRSIRAFEGRAVDPAALGRILEAARLAPTARGDQPWKIVVLQSAETRARLAEEAVKPVNAGLVTGAPCVLVVCATNAEHTMSNGHAASTTNCSAVVENAAVQCAAEGLGSCWIAGYFEDKVKAVLGVPEQHRVVALLAIGHPAEEPKPRKLRPLEELVSYEHW